MQTQEQSLKSILREMFHEVFASNNYDEQVICRYFSSEYTQSVDGKNLDFPHFCEHVRVQKAAVRTLSFKFKTLVEEDDTVFSNHLVSGETVEGRAAEVHVIAEFRFRAGKLVSCDELTHMVSGDDRDRDLGSRH